MPTPYHVRLAVSQYGEQFRAELFTEDLGDTEGDLLTQLPPSVAEWVPYLAQGADLPPDAARQLGKDLFAALLGQPENAKKWSEVLTQAGRNKQSIRLLIDASTEAVRDLPYGLLCEPHDDWFLFRAGRKQSVEFVRILRRCSPRPLKLRDRLQVLVAVAEPRSADVPAFDAPVLLQKLCAALRGDVEIVLCGPDGPRPASAVASDPQSADPAEFAAYAKTTRAALRKSLTGDYDVLHLLAHGHGAGVLLCKNDGTPAATTASELGEWCGAGSTPLAFLQVCKAGSTTGRGGFGGVAQQLLNPRGGNLAAVVASTFPLDAEYSTHAAVEFYRQLAAGKPPGESLTADRPESDWSWAFLELWARPGALGGTQQRAAFQFVSPYRGLSSFSEQEADLFFGRKSEVAELLQVLRGEPAVAVVGDSGSGKTSLLHAGLAHAIRRDGMAGSEHWRIVSLRPGYRPAQAILAALTGSHAEPTPEALQTALRADAQPLMVVFDQFEEVFTLARDKTEVQVLTAALAEAVERQRDRFRLVIGMRSEFLGRAASVPGLNRLIRRPWVLRPPGADDVRDIVAGPAEHCGYTFQGPIADGASTHSVSLLDRILADPLLARDAAGTTTPPLPLLQFALERLWLKAVEKGATEFTHGVFDEIGGMGKAIAQHAEAVFQASGTATEAGTAGRALAEQIITALVSTQGTRQPRVRNALQAETGNPDAARAVVDYLVGERLLTVRTDPEDMSKSLVDLSHEALIQNWDRLRGWLAEDPQGRAMREEFRTAAEKWEAGFAGVQSRSRYGLPGSDVARNYLAWINTSRPRLSPVQQEFAEAMRDMLARKRRRRRLVMGSLAGLALVSTALAIYADAQAGRAKTNEAAAQMNAEVAKKSAEDANAARIEVEKANDEMVSNIARSLLLTMSVQVHYGSLPGLNEPEIAAMWEVGSSKDPRLRSRLLEQALADPVLTRQLSERGTFAFQATLGLDSKRRLQFEESLGKKLLAPELPKEQREDVAICLGHVGVLDRALSEKVVAILTESMSSAFGSRLQQLSESLLEAVAHWEPEKAASAITLAASKIGDPQSLMKPRLAEGLSAIAARAEPDKAVAILTSALDNPNFGSSAPIVLTKGVAAAAARMAPQEAARVCARVAATLSSAIDDRRPPAGANPALPGGQSRRLSALVQGLAALSAHLAPEVSAQVCGKAVAALSQTIKALSKSNPIGNLSGDSVALAQGLLAVAQYAGSKEVAPACSQAIALLMKDFERYALSQLPYPETIAAVAARMEPKEVFSALSSAMILNRGSRIVAVLARSQTAVASRMSPSDAADAAEALVADMRDVKSQDVNDFFDERTCRAESLSRSLSAIAARLEPDDAARIAASLTEAIKSTSNADATRFLAESLSAVAARLEPKAAAGACGQASASVDLAIGKASDPYEVGQLAQGLAALAAHLDSKDATQMCSRAAATLTRVMGKTTDSGALMALAQGLASVAVRLEREEAARMVSQTAATIILAMSQNTAVTALRALLDLSSGLMAVLDRFEPKEAAQVGSRAARILSSSLGKQRGNIVPLQQLFHRLSAIAPHMDPEEAAATLIVAKSRLSESNITDTASWAIASKGISEVISREMSPHSPQILVNFLKHPFCVGETRRLVLDQLSRHYHRPFVDQWEFVEYVQKNKLDLDLTTPLERPRLLPQALRDANQGEFPGA